MPANNFIALSLFAALMSLSVVNSSREVFRPIHSVGPNNNAPQPTEDLQTLVKYEMVDSLILSQAIKSVKDASVKQQLLKFKYACETRIKSLEVLLSSLGLTIPSRSKDATAYLMQGFIVVRGFTGDKGVLKALQLNEKIVLGAYERALKQDLSDDVRPVIQEVYDGIRSHVQYLEDKLNSKVDKRKNLTVFSRI